MDQPARPGRQPDDDLVAAVIAALPPDTAIGVVRDGARTLVAAGPAEVRVGWRDAAFELLDSAARGGMWIGFCSYELGHSIEHVEPRRTGRSDEPAVADVVLARFDAHLVLGEGEPVLVGHGSGRVLLGRALLRARRAAAPDPRLITGPWTSSMTRTEHAAAVAQILELLTSGECYQVNLTRRLTADHPIDPRALFLSLSRVNPAPHAALCTFGPVLPDLAVVSASPELFLHVEGRDVTTAPIKGTARDAFALAVSPKDRAENVMIVDLARNDLGRVCEYGSVQVPSLCRIESHPGLFHLVSTVTGRVRAGLGLGALMRATFPPASVTGAPKPRVLQAIEDLEPVPRGVYCGAIGWIDGDRSRSEWSVAIRTFVQGAGRTHLGVGGGIVADSRAPVEWRETELKAARLLRAAGAGSRLQEDAR
jgi:para-aminobenzoate synthetase component 1